MYSVALLLLVLHAITTVPSFIESSMVLAFGQLEHRRDVAELRDQMEYFEIRIEPNGSRTISIGFRESIRIDDSVGYSLSAETSAQPA